MKGFIKAVIVGVCAYLFAVFHAGLEELTKNEETSRALAFHESDVKLSKEQVQQFHRDGFLVVRNVLPQSTVDTLFAHRPRSVIPFWLKPVDWAFGYFSASHVSIDAIWAESELFRSFWFSGPVPQLVSQVSNDQPVRLLTDIVYGVLKGSRPKFLGKWHKDSTSFDIVERDSAMGLSVWIPLVDIDAVENGGSVYMANISAVEPKCQAQPDDGCSEECMNHLDKVALCYSFARGDILMFTDHTFHRSQPFKSGSSQSDRFALVGRFVQANARFKDSASMEKQRKNFCNHNLQPGDTIDSPCFPQMYPRNVPIDVSQLSHPGGGLHLASNLLDNILAFVTNSIQ